MKDAQGKFIHEEVWKYLFTYPVDKTGDPVPPDNDCTLDLSKPKLTLYKGMGCTRCGDSGYVGRVACAEMIAYDEELRGLITKGFPMDKVKDQLKKQGAITLRQDALLKALEGFTTIEEVMRITAD